MVKCSNCGVEIDDSFNACPNCGNSLVNNTNQNDNLHCSQCGAEITTPTPFCPNCGFKLNVANQQPQTKFCLNCGTKINEESEFCPNCGTNQESGAVPFNKDPVIVMILSFLITGLGHYYIGLKNRALVIFLISIIIGLFGLFNWILLILTIVVNLIFKIFVIYDSYNCTIKLSNGAHVEDEFLGIRILSMH